MTTLHIPHQLQQLLITISFLALPSLSHATLYNVIGNFGGADGADVYGTLSINDSFVSTTIETAWQAYLETPTTDNFFLELEYQITSFDLYRTDTNESFFFGKNGSIEIIVYGHQADTQLNSIGYNAWNLYGSGTALSVYSARNGSDVRFSNNGINTINYDYDQLAQTVQLTSGYYNDDDDNTMVSLTLTEVNPIPEPSTIILLGLGLIFLTGRRTKSTCQRPRVTRVTPV